MPKGLTVQQENLLHTFKDIKHAQMWLKDTMKRVDTIHARLDKRLKSLEDRLEREITK